MHELWMEHARFVEYAYNSWLVWLGPRVGTIYNIRVVRIWWSLYNGIVKPTYITAKYIYNSLMSLFSAEGQCIIIC